MLTRLSTIFRAQPFLVIPVFLVLYGYGTIDVADFYRLSANPLQLNSEVSRQFLQSSPLPYFLGYPFTQLLGQRWSFAIVMLAGLVLFAFSLRRMAAFRYGTRQHDAVLMVFASPLLIVLTQYLGKGDAYLAGALLLLIGSPQSLPQLAAAALMVASHFEMGLIAVALSIFLRLVKPGAAVVGAAIGVAAVLAYHHVLLPSPPQTRADLGVSYLTDALSIAMATPVLHLVWTFGPFWWCASRAWPVDWKWWSAFLVVLTLATLTLDFTRVFVLVGLPLIVSTIDRVMAKLGDDEPSWLLVLPFLAFVQAHLLSSFAYDSRIPELIARLSGSAPPRH